MPTVADFCAFLRNFAPPELAESWDNTGLLVGRSGAIVNRVLTCLTLSPDVAAEAIAENSQLIVTHHPVLFRGAKQICDSQPEGKMLLDLIEAGIAVYSPHTSFDSAAEGINQQLAGAFGLEQVCPLVPTITAPEAGAGRRGQLPSPRSLAEFMKTVRTAVRSDRLEYTGDLSAPVSKVGIACGAAEGFLTTALDQGCDTFVTGEARFHKALEARTLGLNLILLGHFCSERPAVEQLAERLRMEFPQVVVTASAVESNPLRLFQ